MSLNNIARYRKEKKLTLKELSDLTGLSAGYLCHLEHGSRSNPSKKVIEKLTCVLEISVEELFFS